MITSLITSTRNNNLLQYRGNEFFLTKNNQFPVSSGSNVNSGISPLKIVKSKSTNLDFMPNTFNLQTFGNESDKAFNYSNIANYLNMSQDELAKYSIILAKDQMGCRFLQKKIDESSDFADGTLFTCLLSNIIEIMNDPFGNYLVQKIIEKLEVKNYELIMEIVYKPLI